ncbi:hypothetical protein CKAN_01534700 [Cinnamomum micranthum f. kanehirae]|uniref:Uncharacterized protein n=1 Tax=Cinnamomum micranthum f. kanehirae TaxID=337451 RepID=A0A3S3N6R9_9MAGN|nr:hypothetical protein CKAN_01534700 [Cinnamomum micranthum f. kanehirae]
MPTYLIDDSHLPRLPPFYSIPPANSRECLSPLFLSYPSPLLPWLGEEHRLRMSPCKIWPGQSTSRHLLCDIVYFGANPPWQPSIHHPPILWSSQRLSTSICC